jgi:hypothetical protein
MGREVSLENADLALDSGVMIVWAAALAGTFAAYAGVVVHVAAAAAVVVVVAVVADAAAVVVAVAEVASGERGYTETEAAEAFPAFPRLPGDRRSEGSACRHSLELAVVVESFAYAAVEEDPDLRSDDACELLTPGATDVEVVGKDAHDGRRHWAWVEIRKECPGAGTQVGQERATGGEPSFPVEVASWIHDGETWLHRHRHHRRPRLLLSCPQSPRGPCAHVVRHTAEMLAGVPVHQERGDQESAASGGGNGGYRAGQNEWTYGHTYWCLAI